MSTVVPLGCFAVRAEVSEVAAFRAATGLPPEGDALPLTFPMRWMAAPAVRSALTAMIPEPAIVPFHEAQSFDYTRPLLVGAPYTMSLMAHREAEPERLVVVATIAVADGTVHATCETILRLLAVAEAVA